MSKLNVDQKSVLDLFQNERADFLIPDYQRPYAWGEKECETLWSDIFAFAFPDNDSSKFDSKKDEYFLGPIVTFKNDKGQMEVIDGQQRLTTLMLLLRAFYDNFAGMKDQNSQKTYDTIAKCIWKTDELGNPDMNVLKIDSQVASDNDKEEFLSILKRGQVDKNQRSRYAENYRFFLNKIEDFLHSFPGYFVYLPNRILRYCILLPIEADGMDTALRIFSTLNDRGKPLSDADIFKAEFYKYYDKLGQKGWFVSEWKALEEQTNKIFHPIVGTPMDELFTRYMYYVRASQKIKSSTTEALRKFYERDGYALLKKKETFENLKQLSSFWNDVADQDSDRFSEKVLRRLYVLNYAPNSMWTFFTSVYYMKNRTDDGFLDDDRFCEFLNKTTAFVWAYALIHPGVNALRTPVYAEMVNIVEGKEVTFKDFLFDEMQLRSIINNYKFVNNRPITKSMITWWAFRIDKQPLMRLETTIETEHIYARNRYDHEHSLTDKNLVESLGNKAILEKHINIRASDYRFNDKKKYYTGYQAAKGWKEGTRVQELLAMARDYEDFGEQEIRQRYVDIVDAFIDYLKEYNLLRP